MRGVDIYRSVLRLDLVDAYERKATARKVAWIAAALGYVFGTAAAQPTSNCSIRWNERLGTPRVEVAPLAGGALGSLSLRW